MFAGLALMVAGFATDHWTSYEDGESDTSGYLKWYFGLINVSWTLILNDGVLLCLWTAENFHSADVFFPAICFRNGAKCSKKEASVEGWCPVTVPVERIDPKMCSVTISTSGGVFLC